MTDSDAQALICYRRGLTSPELVNEAGSVERRQRAAHGGGASPWSLRDLVYLEGVRWRWERSPDVEGG